MNTIERLKLAFAVLVFAIALALGFWLGRATSPSCPPMPAQASAGQVLTTGQGNASSNGYSKTTIRFPASNGAGSDDRSSGSRDRGVPLVSGRGEGTPPFLALPGGSGDVSIIRSDRGLPKLNRNSNDGSMIEVVVETGVQASASAAAGSNIGSNSRPSHGRLGVVGGTFPGVFAPSFQLVVLPIPEGVAGLSLEASVDAEANLDQVGVMATVGQKGFAGVGAFTRWNLADQGVFVGAGLRF